MRIRGDSKLNAQAKTILRLRQEKMTIAQIRQALNKDGLAVGYTTLRDWLDRHREEGDKPSGAQPRPRYSQPELQRSLGLLEAASDVERSHRVIGALRILWLPGHDWTESSVESSLGAGSLDIPFNRDGGPDFTAYAKRLGRKRLKSLGDMDFVLLAMWTRIIRKELQTPVTNFAEARRRSATVLGVAREIHDEMFASVGLL